MELWLSKAIPENLTSKSSNPLHVRGIFENSTSLRHVLQNKPKTMLPFRIWLSIFWWRPGGGFWLLQKWDTIDNLRTYKLFLPVKPSMMVFTIWSEKKRQRTSNIFGKHVTQGVTKNWRPQHPPKRFDASTMLYFFEMATYLKGHGLTEIWRRKLPIIRLERSQKTWCKVGKKPEVGSDLYHCLGCFYILFPKKKLDGILLPLDGEFQWMSKFWGDLSLKSFPGWLLRDPPHPENGQPPHCPALKHVETPKKHVSTRIPPKTEVSKCMIFFVVLILGDNFETSRIQ